MIMILKLKKIQFKPRIKLNQNIYADFSENKKGDVVPLTRDFVPYSFQWVPTADISL